MEPVVSIISLTYNHEPYIRQTLEGFLMQKTDFPFEIVIHDDASTDGTQAVIKEFEESFPGIVKPIYQKENQKSKGGGIVTKTVFSAARGKYIAFCEGDDYWIDALKLQKQVDFLEANNEYVLCFHNAYLINNGEPIQYDKTFYKYAKEDYTIEDLFESWFIPTASVLFRKSVLPPFPNWFFNSPVGDTPLYIILANYGKIKLLKEVMSVYRNHIGGVSRSVGYSFWERLAVMYDDIDVYFNKQYHKLILLRKATVYYNLTQLALVKNDFKYLRKASKELIKLSLSAKSLPRKYVTIAIVSIFPNLYMKYKKVFS